MDDERKPITYTCPICKEDQPNIYFYPETGGQLKVTEEIYFTGMCGECLQQENPMYYRELKSAETEAKSWKSAQARKSRSSW